MTTGLSHYHAARHELRTLALPTLCACGRPAVNRGRCESCQQLYDDIALDARREMDDER